MDNEDDEVGYQKPPKKSQWQKGQSGNPSGKKKAEPTPVMPLLAWIAQKLHEDIETTHGGAPVRMPAAELMATVFVHKLIQGSLKEQAEVLRILKQVGILEFLGLPMKPKPPDKGGATEVRE